MAEEGSSASPILDIRQSELAETKNSQRMNHLSQIKSVIADNEVYRALQRHFLMQGKGRRPCLPHVEKLTNGLLLQLYFIKEEAGSNYRELQAWLQRLIPSCTTSSVSQIHRKITALLAVCADFSIDQIHIFLKNEPDANFLPHGQVLVAFGVDSDNIHSPDSYSQSPHEDVSNEVVIALSLIMKRYKKPHNFVKRWLLQLSLSCQRLSHNRIQFLVKNALERYGKLLRLKKNKRVAFDRFMKEPFVKEDQFSITSTSRTIYETKQNSKELTDEDKGTYEKEQLTKAENSTIKRLKREINSLNNETRELNAAITIKDKVIKDIQMENREISSKLTFMKSSQAKIPLLEKKIAGLQSNLDEVESKVFYKRNVDLKARNEALKLELEEYKEDLRVERFKNTELKKKIKVEQDLKSKYKNNAEVLAKENEFCLYELNCEKEEKDIQLTQQEGNCKMYSNSVRQLYMALQGKANVAAAQASRVVSLVGKYLFKKDIPSTDLPCPKTSLNFMTEANHIAKQHIVNLIKASNYFTYASDGTSREKKRYLEHHIVLDNGSTLSVGFSEVVDEKADTLLEKSLALFDELSDVHCQSNDSEDKNTIFQCIINKLMCLMSDRAATMKSFNKKMLQYKKDMLGGGALVHFLYCNAHFLIGLANATEKAVKRQEDLIEASTSSDAQERNDHWSSNETSTSCLIRSASNVFGPRGDEKNGCRAEWLSHCDSKNVKSQFTSYRSNRFNNTFENALAVVIHREDSIYFLKHRVSHSNGKLKRIIHDLGDKGVLSIVTAIALLSTYLTTPYWLLMNSDTPYGQFPAYVRAMQAALQRWSSTDHNINDLPKEEPIFGTKYGPESEVAYSFLKSNYCDENLASTIFKDIATQCLIVLERQLSDFIVGGIYGGELPVEIQALLDSCPLTNLTGERMFGDLDYDMTRRRTATTHLRSTLNMWKHNDTSAFLDAMSPDALRNTMAAGRKHGKELKRKYDESTKKIQDDTKARLQENERQQEYKVLQDKERQAAMLGDILSQGGLCHTKEDIERLLRGPSKLQNLKVQMRFRKYYMGAKELSLTGNFRTLLSNFCSFLDLDLESNESTEEVRDSSNRTMEE